MRVNSVAKKMRPAPDSKRRYTGPAKGSQEAKDRMAKVRAAQWAKNGLVVSQAYEDAAPAAPSRD